MMGNRRRSFGLAALAVLGVALLAGAAHADQPPLTPAWHDGTVVFYAQVNSNTAGVNQGALPDVVSNPLYSFGFPIRPQLDVLSLIPGEPGYSPWWHVIAVVVLDGRDVATDPYTSEAEILDAANANPPRVALFDTGFVFLCQVLPGGGG